MLFSVICVVSMGWRVLVSRQKLAWILLDLNTATVNTNLNSDKRGTSFTATHIRLWRGGNLPAQI